MNATIEERLARYAAQLDDAADRAVPRDTRAPRAPRRGPVSAALAVAAVVVIALGVAVANRSGHHAPTVGPSSIATSTTPTNPPSSAATTTTARTTTTTTSTTSAPVAGTRQVVYQPFTGAVMDSTLHVTAQDSGSCIHEPSGGHDDYRCFSTAGGTIYDPCFAGPLATAQPLVCPSDPTTPNVVTFTATSVTQASGSSVAHPWALQLSGGRVCLFVSAAWSGLGPYSCSASSGNPPVADCHEAVRATPWWTAECQPTLSDTSPFGPQRVIAVWY